MRAIALVTDSSCCLPAPPPDGLTVLPIAIHLADGDLHDGMAEAEAAVYGALRRGDPVKSSAPTPAEYLDAIEEAPGDAVVVVTPAAEFTTMHRSASVAADIASRPVVVVDSRTAAAAQGLIVLAALDAARAGGSLRDVAAAAEDAVRRAELVAALDGVEHVRRSGRVPPFAVDLARRLGVRPVFRFGGGAVERVGVPRSPEAAVRGIEREWAARGGPEAERAAIFHAAAPERAGALERAVGGAGLRLQFSPSMGIHTGPGVVGVAWLRRPA